MARIKPSIIKTGKSILLIDDQEDYRNTTASIIQREGHEVVTVASGEEGLKLLKERCFDLLLLDYFMPGGFSGEETVIELRKFNPIIQIILQTGYAGENPPREMLKKLDIQGYHDKSDGPENLLMWIDIGLKAAFTVQHLNRSRQSLRYILDITPELHKIQQLEELLQGILLQVSGLLGIMNTFIAIFPNEDLSSKKNDNTQGFIALLEETELQIKVATGRFSDIKNINFNNNSINANIIRESLNQKEIKIVENMTIIPLCIGKESLGVIYLEQSINLKEDIELLNIFANQAAVAIQNTRLYEMATLDPLTGLYVRRFFDQCLLRELRIALRSNLALTLIILDLNNLKIINDLHGHLAGDQALTIIGKVLNKATRSTDYPCRYGGDEFTILLTNTSVEKSEVVVNRIITQLKEELIQSSKGQIPIKISIGVSGIEISKLNNAELPHPVPNEYFDKIANNIIESADTMLYKAKEDKNNSLAYYDAELKWPAFDKK